MSSAPSPLTDYPFVRLDRIKSELRAAGRRVIDLGVGEPQEETPEFIRAALAAALDPRAPYPRAAGLPELREAAAGWCRERFSVAVDPESEVIPTLGSKEPIFSLPQVLAPPGSDKDLVVTTTPGYPIPGHGARAVGADVVEVPLAPEEGWLPARGALADVEWGRVALFWVNYPNNPTGAVAGLSFFEEMAGLAAEHGFVLASDEAYVDIYFDSPPPSALEVTDRSHVVAFHSLSKRSAMPGYRSGFAAGAEWIIDRLKQHRPYSGTTPQAFVQKASAAAWSDAAHAADMRAVYGTKREVFLDVFHRHGLRVEGSEGSFFLWLRVPGAEPASEFAERLARSGVIVAPERFFGPRDQHVRISLVVPLAECEEAAVAICQAADRSR
ncbi:MAG TPA: aminotransferase class I/II-fold pyridoxal phosphate-dependent enzyme [Actinomycetota bacterium]|nr:aminotransferase class I/II-fold pyridoxal phosphate-dependent enzyme [Actinomycetota bacterium]